MNFSAIIAAQWTFGINDPSFIAWLIVAVYFIAAIVCWRARSSQSTAHASATPMLWTALSLSLILLGFNKQLDLHPLLVDVVRDLVAGHRDSFVRRVVLVSAGGIIAVSTLLVGVKLLRGSSRPLRWSLATFTALLAFQVVRFLPGPISGLLVTHVFSEEEGLLHIHIIELLELASLVIIGLLARVEYQVCSKPLAGDSAEKL